MKRGQSTEKFRENIRELIRTNVSKSNRINN
jgi:hypothetical protein